MALQVSGLGKIKKIGKLHLNGDHCFLKVTISFMIKLPNTTAQIVLILNQKISLQQQLSNLALNDLIAFKGHLGRSNKEFWISSSNFKVIENQKSNRLKNFKVTDVIDNDLLKQSLLEAIKKLHSTSQ